MKYDAIAIGKRIQKCRKEYRDKDYCPGVPDQASFGAILKGNPDKGYDRKTISSWENGERIPPLDAMLRMCDLFGCDLGYLLCEYDTKTRVAADVQEEIGLSEDAINALRSAKQKPLEPLNLPLSLIDHFIIDCAPIVSGSLAEIFSDYFRQNVKSSLTSSTAEKKERLFYKIYLGDYPEHLKPQIFIDEVIKEMDDEWLAERLYNTPEEREAYLTMQKNDYMRDYERLIIEKEMFDTTAMNRYHMNLVFDQMIDKILDSLKDKSIELTEDISKKVNNEIFNERQGSNHGEHEEK